jgi:hypothetical protein
MKKKMNQNNNKKKKKMMKKRRPATRRNGRKKVARCREASDPRWLLLRCSGRCRESDMLVDGLRSR